MGLHGQGGAGGPAEIVAFTGNFHGRTTTMFRFLPTRRANGFGPYGPGFVVVPSATLTAELGRRALDERTVAVLVEPVQGEAGVIIPPPGYLAGRRERCTAHGILMIADEVQTGLGRTGFTFACTAENVMPDAYLLGKALGGGILPPSAMVSTCQVLGVLRPGQHGSTFAGNPLACAVAREVIAILRTGKYQARSALLGEKFHARLAALPRDVVREVRGRGLWAGWRLLPVCRAARCARGWRRTACSPRRRTGTRSGSRRRW